MEGKLTTEMMLVCVFFLSSSRCVADGLLLSLSSLFCRVPRTCGVALRGAMIFRGLIGYIPWFPRWVSRVQRELHDYVTLYFVSCCYGQLMGVPKQILVYSV